MANESLPVNAFWVKSTLKIEIILESTDSAHETR